jgi:polynucleotide 5'-hydroxyl-kinase GRC3/NOL9
VAAIVPGPGWDTVLGRLAGDTVMVVGRVDRGKSHLTRWLVAQAAVRRAAIVSADMGQPAIGPPACLAMAIRRPWRTPDALWFIGETSPVRHLVPTVVGTARLAERARAAGAQLVVIDTGGLVEGPIARLLKSHKARAAAVTDVVAVEEERELEPLLALLGGMARVHRVAPARVARERDRDERRAYREARFRAHLRGAVTLRVTSRRLIGADWSAGSAAGKPSPGTLVGLIDRAGFCLAAGVVRAVRGSVIELHTRWRDARSVTCVQVGRFALDPGGGEVRWPGWQR